ncbi:uncharacterized protein LOC113099806 [Carassius auratus]|uniref:Uncharacterized protein LOC113099806 n=1 Tax=Carassius auratus TaxID=7957 RepID=A0A6P6PIJ6_CARAU|nr:uncharacterized protein LOC113099806 [Carassius auratus]
MLELGTCSVSAQALSDHNALAVPSFSQGMCGGSLPSQSFLLQPQDPESWLKHRGTLEDGSHPCTLLEPQSLADSFLSHACSFDTLYVPHAHPMGLAPTSLDLGGSCEGAASLCLDPVVPVSPNIIKRRRGGLIEQRDIVKAHEAHKIQSTPQARRKEWEMARFGEDVPGDGGSVRSRNRDAPAVSTGAVSPAFKQTKAQRARTHGLIQPHPGPTELLYRQQIALHLWRGQHR